jgi:hypothetical protein
MLKYFVILFLILTVPLLSAAQPDLSYYLPDGISYDSMVPKPASVIGHEVGEYHVSHDKLVQYMMALDEASDRISLEVTGHTHEGRPLLLLTITSPDNHKNLEAIRTQHLQRFSTSDAAFMAMRPVERTQVCSSLTISLQPRVRRLKTTCGIRSFFLIPVSILTACSDFHRG